MKLRTLQLRVSELPSRIQSNTTKRVRLSGRRLQRLRAEVLSRDPLCAHCKAKGIFTAAEEVDHIVPLHQGGSHDRTNLAGLCKSCHREKTRRELRYE